MKISTAYCIGLVCYVEGEREMAGCVYCCKHVCSDGQEQTQQYNSTIDYATGMTKKFIDHDHHNIFALHLYIYFYC